MGEFEEGHLHRLLYTLLITFGLILFEMAFIAMTTGNMFIQFSFPLLNNMEFFLRLAGDDPIITLRMIFVDLPLMVIESKHKASGSTVWSLHYYIYAVIVHLVVAYLLAEKVGLHGIRTRLRDIPFGGPALLIFSSIYLLLAGCCTSGPNWLFHTWLLAVVFNPVTSSNETIKLYQSIKDWFALLQLMTGLIGAYLMFRHYHQNNIEPDGLVSCNNHK